MAPCCLAPRRETLRLAAARVQTRNFAANPLDVGRVLALMLHALGEPTDVGALPVIPRPSKRGPSLRSNRRLGVRPGASDQALLCGENTFDVAYGNGARQRLGTHDSKACRLECFTQGSHRKTAVPWEACDGEQARHDPGER